MPDVQRATGRDGGVTFEQRADAISLALFKLNPLRIPYRKTTEYRSEAYDLLLYYAVPGVSCSDTARLLLKYHEAVKRGHRPPLEVLCKLTFENVWPKGMLHDVNWKRVAQAIEEYVG